MKDEPLPIFAVLTLFLRSMTALTQGLAPLVAGAAAFVQRLQEQCPEAFDEDGALRPNWQEIAQAKFAAPSNTAPAPKITLPEFHTCLATRRIPIHLN